MLKRLSLVPLVAALALTVSCASKKKSDAVVEPGVSDDQGKMDANVSSKDIGLDPKGSDGGNISGLNSVHFDYDSSTLSTESRRQLSENADWIKRNGKFIVQIEGHCDSRGSSEYNLALGTRRAEAVKNYLIGLGLEGKRMTIISYGEEKPIDTSDSEQAYAKNRRANFVPVPQ